jgi:PAS domain S-box-containing protein
MSSSARDLKFWEDLGKSAPIAVIATDLEGSVRVWSSGAESLFGWSSEETIGRPIQEVTVGPLERDIAQQIMDQVASGSPWEGNFHALNKHSEVIEIHTLDFLVRDVEGRPVGIVGLSFRLDEDSQSNQVEELLELARKVCESRWRANTRTARVLHDEIAQFVATARTEALAVVEGGVGTGGPAELIADYLDRALERLRKEVAVLLESEIDVWELIIQCHERTRQMQARAGVLVECQIIGTVESFQNLNAPVAEAAFLVIREALRNAEQHANARHVELRLKAERSFLEVTVIDDGLGMGRSRDGAGLTLLRDTVAQLKGLFEVRSINQVELSGTVLTASFPLGGRGGADDQTVGD